MATTPQYATTPNIGMGNTPGTVDTSLTAPTNVTTLFTAGASGSKIEYIRFNQIVTTAGGGSVNLFIHDGTNYRLFDHYDFGAFTISATAESTPVEFTYNALELKNGWTIRCTQTAAAVAAFTVIVGGNDY